VALSWVLAGTYVLLTDRHASGDWVAAPGVSDDASSDATDPAPSPSPSVVATNGLAPSGDIRAALASYAATKKAHVGIAVFDRVTGATVTYNDGVRFATASVVKMDILATVLYQNQKAGRQLSATQKALATKMITASDNNAATSLWNSVGGASGVAAANKVFGLTQTKPNYAWGMTTTTPSDQVRLLGVLTNPNSPLSQANQQYELGLMAKVEADQRWGVPRAAGTGATGVYNKNGWLASIRDRGRWIVNSVGRIVEPGHDWLVAVLSDHSSSMGSGITVIEHETVTAVNGLRSAPPTQ
jgi:beta-lactamase class A